MDSKLKLGYSQPSQWPETAAPRRDILYPLRGEAEGLVLQEVDRAEVVNPEEDVFLEYLLVPLAVHSDVLRQEVNAEKQPQTMTESGASQSWIWSWGRSSWDSLGLLTLVLKDWMKLECWIITVHGIRPVLFSPVFKRGEFESKPNWVHIFMLLYLPAWIMKWIILLTIWREDVVKAAFFYLLNIHQLVRPKSVTPCHPSPSKDYSFGTQCQGKMLPLSWDYITLPLHMSGQIAALFTRDSSGEQFAVNVDRERRCATPLLPPLPPPA